MRLKGQQHRVRSIAKMQLYAWNQVMKSMKTFSNWGQQNFPWQQANDWNISMHPHCNVFHQQSSFGVLIHVLRQTQASDSKVVYNVSWGDNNNMWVVVWYYEKRLPFQSQSSGVEISILPPRSTHIYRLINCTLTRYERTHQQNTYQYEYTGPVISVIYALRPR